MCFKLKFRIIKKFILVQGWGRLTRIQKSEGQTDNYLDCNTCVERYERNLQGKKENCKLF